MTTPFSCLSHSLCLIFSLAALTGCGGGGTGELSSDSTIPDPPDHRPDPFFQQQWHLANTGQFPGAVSGQDLRLSGLQETGKGTIVSVIDGAIEIGHPDLRRQFIPSKSFSYRNGGSDPSPPKAGLDAPFNPGLGQVDDAHGTAVAGIIAATAQNGIGGQGVAPQSQLIGFDTLVNPTHLNLADAIQRSLDSNADILNNSWGPVDPFSGGNRSFYFASQIWKAAVQNAIDQGRNGLGLVIVFAAGNGGLASDQSNYDEYSNDPRVISVGAVDERGRPIDFSEPGANVLVAAFSGDELGLQRTSTGIFTTDIAGPRGYSTPRDSDPDYTQFFDGTSAAAPMVSGVVALMLEANPRLTWRDVKWILAKTARAASGKDSPGRTTLPSALNLHGYDPVVGFGIVDAQAAVRMAREFKGLGRFVECDSGQLQLEADRQPIPDNSRDGVVTTYFILPSQCAIKTVETVELTLAIDHPYSGDLRIVVESPSSNKVSLSAPHACIADQCTNIRSGFRFGLARFKGESASGTWRVFVSDEAALDTGRMLWWRLVVRGH